MFSSAAIDTVYAQASRHTAVDQLDLRSLHLGFNARAECIEPQFVWDAVRDLGLNQS